MKKLILTVGLPRSGKTTWARLQGFPIVNPDSIRLAIHGKPYLRDAEPWVWLMAKTMVKALFLAGHDEVIVDATNTSVKRREFWQGDRDWKLYYRYMPASVDDCLGRVDKGDFEEEHKEVLRAAIRLMGDSYEPVESGENIQYYE